MKIEVNDPPRQFTVGAAGQITLSDCGRVALDPDEQVTFTTEQGAEYDVARKSWGFYATPSINGRLRTFGWKTALVRNAAGLYYVFLVEQGREAELQIYLETEELTVACWLDDAALAALDAGD